MVFLGFAFGLIISIAVGIVSFLEGEANIKQQAVEKGYAEYYLDKDNNKQWRFRDDLLSNSGDKNNE